MVILFSVRRNYPAVSIFNTFKNDKVVLKFAMLHIVMPRSYQDNVTLAQFEVKLKLCN